MAQMMRPDWMCEKQGSRQELTRAAAISNASQKSDDRQLTRAAAVECVAEEVEQDLLARRLHTTKGRLHVRRYLQAGGRGGPGRQEERGLASRRVGT